jgi:hypothetical protein
MYEAMSFLVEAASYSAVLRPSIKNAIYPWGFRGLKQTGFNQQKEKETGAVIYS